MRVPYGFKALANVGKKLKIAVIGEIILAPKEPLGLISEQEAAAWSCGRPGPSALAPRVLLARDQSLIKFPIRCSASQQVSSAQTRGAPEADVIIVTVSHLVFILALHLGVSN